MPRSLPFERTSTPVPPSQDPAATWAVEQVYAAAAGGAVPTSTANGRMAKTSTEGMGILHRPESTATVSPPATLRHANLTDSTPCLSSGYQTPLCSVSHILTVNIDLTDWTTQPFG